MPFHDFYCKKCGAEKKDAAFDRDDPKSRPRCPKRHGVMDVDFLGARIMVDAWGGPRHIEALGGEFATKDDARREMKRLGLMEAGDRIGGARTQVTGTPDPPVDKETRRRYASFGPEAQ